MSLAHSFDVKEPTDLLRGLQNALNEYDQSKEEGDKPKMVFLSYTIDYLAINFPSRYSAAFSSQVVPSGRWAHQITLFHIQILRILPSLSYLRS